MKAEVFLQTLFNRYPLVYGNRVELLDHIFSVIGNGYEWKNGEIVSDVPMEELQPFIPAGVIKAEQLSDTPSISTIMSDKYTLYPLSDSSLIFHIPEDVREDWLAVAVEWIDYLSKNRTITAHDRFNNFTKKQYDESSLKLEELVIKYL